MRRPLYSGRRNSVRSESLFWALRFSAASCDSSGERECHGSRAGDQSSRLFQEFTSNNPRGATPCSKSIGLPSLAMNFAGHRNHGSAEAVLIRLCGSPSRINSESPPESPSWPPLVTQRLAMVTVASQIL